MPAIAHTAAGTPIENMTFLPSIYAINAEKLDAKFTILAFPDAVIRLNPNIPVKHITKKVPVPGPKNPSYAPKNNPIIKDNMYSFLLDSSFLFLTPKFLLNNKNNETIGKIIIKQ